MTDISAAEAAELVTGTVRVPVLKEGKPVIENSVYQTEVHKIGEADILSAKVRGDQLVVVTVDGQKLAAPAPAPKPKQKPEK